MHAQDKINTQRQEAAANKPPRMDASDYEDGALGRRTDSLTAALGLLEDKLHLMNAASNVPRVDMHRIRADVEREMAAKMEADMAGRMRTVGDAIRLEGRETVRRKDAEIAELQAQVQQMHSMLQQQQQHNGDAQALHEQQLVERLRVRDSEVEGLEQIKTKMMADRAVLEQIIRNERKQREDEFNDMDANVHARDQKIQELSEMLENSQHRGAGANAYNVTDMQRRLDAKDTELYAKVAKIEELQTVSDVFHDSFILFLMGTAALYRVCSTGLR